MRRSAAFPCVVGFAVAALTVILSPTMSPRGGVMTSTRAVAAPAYLPEATPARAEMDHGEKYHHVHQHLADHKGSGHNPAGIGDHHHHHHNHPHAADPKHHHPY